MSVGEVFRDLLTHPGRMLIERWNWKAAALASVFRGLLFFGSTWKAGWRAATAAMLAEFCYRALTSGFWGAMTQAFESARPTWLATICALVFIPAVSHGLELLLHWLRGTPHLWAGMTTSVAFTAISTLFNLYAMRQGAMLVGSGARSFGSDMQRMPQLIAGFILLGPKALWALMGKP